MKGFDGFKPHHLPLEPKHCEGNDGLGRVFFLPGSDGRAQRIGDRFEALETLPSDRRHNVYLGRLTTEIGSADVGTVATGMGCPSLDIVVTELIAMGARRFIRVGTSGSLQPDTVRAGDLVVATAAVRDEGVSNRYICTEYPAVAHGDMVAALERAARGLGVQDRVFKGVIHSKDSLFGREMGYGPLAAENAQYMDRLREIGVLASEMEAAHLFVLSQVYSRTIAPIGAPSTGEQTVKSGAVAAIIGDESAFASKDLAQKAEKLAIDVALRAAVELVKAETA